jgi:flagellar motor switch/type III secretory pathway protein FliN
MADLSPFVPFLDLPLAVEALLEGPTLTVDQLLSLGVGGLVTTTRRAGETIDLFAGGARIGAGELGAVKGHTVLRMVSFKGAD